VRAGEKAKNDDVCGRIFLQQENTVEKSRIGICSFCMPITGYGRRIQQSRFKLYSLCATGQGTPANGTQLGPTRSICPMVAQTWKC
jgi:hypothetical protein